MTYEEWATLHPQAAEDLITVVAPARYDGEQKARASGKSEAWAQQQVRLKIAKAGGAAWRNNVGATPSKCSTCGARQVPVRYGLANESSKLNKQIKSSDLIGVIPLVIEPHHVGTVVAQFAAIECKRPGWEYAGTEREVAQLAWLTLVEGLGGYATFSTGDIKI